MTQTQLHILNVLKARMDTAHPSHSASDEIRAAFDGPAKLYLRTWVLPLIQALIDNGEGVKSADQVKYDLGWRTT